MSVELGTLAVPESIRVILMAMIPLGELRTSIPFAKKTHTHTQHFSSLVCVFFFAISCKGNLVPVYRLCDSRITEGVRRDIKMKGEGRKY